MFVPYGAWFQQARQIGFDKMNMQEKTLFEGNIVMLIASSVVVKLLIACCFKNRTSARLGTDFYAHSRCSSVFWQKVVTYTRKLSKLLLHVDRTSVARRHTFQYIWNYFRSFPNIFSPPLKSSDLLETCILFLVFMWRNNIAKLNITFPSKVLVSSDNRPCRNLTFHNALARQGSSYCNRARLNFQVSAWCDMTMAARENCRGGQEKSYRF